MATRIVFSTFVLVLAACAPQRDISQVSGAVDEFHSRLANHEYERISADAMPEFRKSMGPERTSALFTRISTKLGAPVSSQFTRVQVNHMQSGTFVQAHCQTRFAGGFVEEQFTWRVDDERLRLVAYVARSPALDR